MAYNLLSNEVNNMFIEITPNVRYLLSINTSQSKMTKATSKNLPFLI